ncbi:hypothetical protein [Streptomyces niveiscabiei]|uniref:hypothetical protein n=1 Tax=Streptomyces niveiscabiei TaxID=164115 RepID=UPI0038F69A60
MSPSPDAHPDLDALLDKLSLDDKLELVRRVRVGSLTLSEGDRVQARRRLHGSALSEDLEAEVGRYGSEPADYHVPFHVPAGTPGRISLVRQYVAPFPYRVLFDNDVELNVVQGDIERIEDVPPAVVRQQEEDAWHIPPGEFFSIRCSRWVPGKGRPCPQYKGHRGKCGLPPRSW